MRESPVLCQRVGVGGGGTKPGGPAGPGTRRALARISRPQANGRLERFRGELQRGLLVHVGAPRRKAVRGPPAGRAGDVLRPSGQTEPAAGPIKRHDRDEKRMSTWQGKDTTARAFLKSPPPEAVVVTDKRAGSSIVSGEGARGHCFWDLTTKLYSYKN